MIKVEQAMELARRFADGSPPSEELIAWILAWLDLIAPGDLGDAVDLGAELALALGLGDRQGVRIVPAMRLLRIARESRASADVARA